MALAILHLSDLVRSPLLDGMGERVGRVDDVIVRPGGESHPQVTGLVAAIGGRELFVPIWRVSSLAASGTRLEGETVNLGRFERRPGELLLARDLSSRHLINVVGARLIRANEIELACVEAEWRVVGVDPSSRGVLRRLLPRALGRRIGPGPIVDWESIEPFVAHVPSARMRIPYRKLARLRPAQIADLVEAASHEEGEEIIEAVGQDHELEADVFEELDSDHQREFLEARSDEDAARLLATMAPDDAADLIADLDQERRMPVLEALPAKQQAKVRALLSYHPETAGGLMSPDFLVLAESTTVAAALDAVRASEAPPEALSTIYASDGEGHLVGTVSIVRLVKSESDVTLASIAERDPVTVRPDADLHAIVRKMSDFNLAASPVVDHDHRMLGVVTVDDVLELLMPSGWRRDFGMSAAQE
ncbi:MAG TPA: CBS domain-containing protein [Acidimicrobiales bacterium]|nr:CBS domain-containing protein [Acidimicrobiales bacterium]